MKVAIKHSGRIAHPNSALPQYVLKQGEEREDLPDAVAERVVELGWGEFLDREVKVEDPEAKEDGWKEPEGLTEMKEKANVDADDTTGSDDTQVNSESGEGGESTDTSTNEGDGSSPAADGSDAGADANATESSDADPKPPVKVAKPKATRKKSTKKS